MYVGTATGGAHRAAGRHASAEPAAAPTTAPAAPAATLAPTVAPATAPAAKPAGVALGQLPTFIPFQGPPPTSRHARWDGLPRLSELPQRQALPDRQGSSRTRRRRERDARDQQPARASAEQNAAWQAVNKAINAKLNVTLIPFGDFNAKWATMQAGSDLPDLMCTITRPDVPIVPAFLMRSART